MEKEKTTIYDVAAAAGVSTATVSRVINGSPLVAEETRLRVEQAIETLRFQPDRAARTLAQQGYLTLAVALPSFTSFFYIELLKGVKDVLREHDIDLLLFSLGSIEPYQLLRRSLQRGKVDALLLASLPVDAALEADLLKLEAPVVLIGTQAEPFDSFFWDEVEATRKAVAHLTDQGHRRIGLIAAHPWSFTSESRIRGYRRALEAASLPFDPDLVQAGHTKKHAGFSEEAGYEAMNTLLALPNPPSAVVASADVQALGAMKALHDAGKRIPDDVAVVGFDDIKISHYINLTSLDPDVHGAGRRAVERLLYRLSNPQAPAEAIELPTVLNVRASSVSR